MRPCSRRGAHQACPVAVRVGDDHAVSGELRRSPSSGGRPRAHRLEVFAESRLDGSGLRLFGPERVPGPSAGGQAEEVLLDKLLERCRVLGLLKARVQQRTDSTHVLAAIRVLNRLELVAETLRATLNALATVAPDWLQGLAPLAWYERYSRRIEDTRLPREQAQRDAYAQTVGADGFHLLDALDAPQAPRACGVTHYCHAPSDLAAPLRADSACAGIPWRAPRVCGAFQGEPGIATGRRGHRITLRCRGALPPQTRHPMDRVHGARQRNVRAHRPAPPHPRPHDPSHRP